MENKEMVNHPSHYGGVENVYEAIKIIEALDNSPVIVIIKNFLKSV